MHNIRSNNMVILKGLTVLLIFGYIAVIIAANAKE